MKTPAAVKPQTLVRLQVRNVKRITAVAIDPPTTGVVSISGRNAQGKSSVLESIALALRGPRAAPPRLIREGQHEAEIVATFRDFEITRVWDERGHRVEIMPTRGGSPVKRPQDFLETFYGESTLDAASFLGLSPREQRERLIDLAGIRERLAALEDAIADARERVRMSDAATGAARTRAEQASAATAGKERPTQVLGDMNVDEAIAEHGRAMERVRAAAPIGDRLRFARAQEQQAAAEMPSLDSLIVRLERELSEARAARADADVRKATWVNRVVELDAEFAAACPAPEAIEALADSIAHAREREQHLRVFVAHGEAITAREEAERDNATVRARLAELQAEKQDALRGAKFPIEGLGFDDDGPTFNGLPLVQASRSEQVKLLTLCEMARNPNCRVLLNREGSLLDSESRAVLHALAVERGYQIWLECVDDDGEGIVIEDGHVAVTPRRIGEEG